MTHGVYRWMASGIAVSCDKCLFSEADRECFRCVHGQDTMQCEFYNHAPGAKCTNPEVICDAYQPGEPCAKATADRAAIIEDFGERASRQEKEQVEEFATLIVAVKLGRAWASRVGPWALDEETGEIRVQSILARCEQMAQRAAAIGERLAGEAGSTTLEDVAEALRAARNAG